MVRSGGMVGGKVGVMDSGLAGAVGAVVAFVAVIFLLGCVAQWGERRGERERRE